MLLRDGPKSSQVLLTPSRHILTTGTHTSDVMRSNEFSFADRPEAEPYQGVDNRSTMSRRARTREQSSQRFLSGSIVFS